MRISHVDFRIFLLYHKICRQANLLLTASVRKYLDYTFISVFILFSIRCYHLYPSVSIYIICDRRIMRFLRFKPRRRTVGTFVFRTSLLAFCLYLIATRILVPFRVSGNNMSPPTIRIVWW